MVDTTREEVTVHLGDSVRNQAREIANRLRQSADKIENLAGREMPVNLHDLKPDSTDLTALVLHEVTTMMANLRLDGLVQRAAVFDRYVREVE